MSHPILLNKLKYYGICGKALAWFGSYLRDRQQFVMVNGVNSSCKTINIGVPQGSVLGPLLFLIFINDMPSSNNLFTLLFADDTTMQNSHSNLNELVLSTNINLLKAASWF